MVRLFLLMVLLATSLEAVKCEIPGCEEEGSQVCSGCSSARYCGKKHQRDDWTNHKSICPKISLVKTTWPKPTVVRESQPEKLVSSALKYVESRGQAPKILIVGCGKKPSPCCGTDQESDHSHIDAFTISIDENIEPDGLWDWLNAVPSKLYEKFDMVYLERLPAGVLRQHITFKNVFAVLKKGGKLNLDMQLDKCAREGFREVAFLGSPFQMLVEPKTIEIILGFGKEVHTNKNEIELFGQYLKLCEGREAFLSLFLSQFGFRDIKIEKLAINPFNNRKWNPLKWENTFGSARKPILSSEKKTQ